MESEKRKMENERSGLSRLKNGRMKSRKCNL